MKPLVLLVDDEPDITGALKLVLRNEPFDIVTANSAKAGLDILAEKPVSVVVSDERMPQMSGAEFLTRVKTNWPGVQRIVLTGEASLEATIVSINDAAIFRFLLKPCPPDQLATAIHEALAVGTAVDLAPAVDPEVERAFDEALPMTYMKYQPIVAFPERRLHAYEALVRVDHPTIGSPVDLIRSASQLDRRFDLDRRVRTLVAADAANLPKDALVFVNLLPESLADDELLEGRDDLARYSDRVVLEVTERAPLSAIDDAEERLDTLRKLGYRLALDDLGAGYAGLTSLVAMKPDIVKFDMELIRDIHLDPDRSSLVSAMVVVSHDLGAVALAEGIEAEAEIDHLVGLGCDLFQGFGISKPELPFVTV
ncbi:MAG: EAL domain-containing protein [Actinomycetota bacterium]